MGDFNSIGQDRGIIYTCNCGWFDRGHAFTAPSKRSFVGPFRLWNSLLKEDGPPDVIGRVPIPAFVVTYRQDAVKKVGGMAAVLAGKVHNDENHYMTHARVRSKRSGTAGVLTTVMSCVCLVGCGSGGGQRPGAGGAAAGGASGGPGGGTGLGAGGAGGAGGGAAVETATFFVSDSINNAVYRFNVTANGDPVATGTLRPGFQPAGIGLAPTGELLVAQNLDNGDIARYAAPLTTLTPNGSITGFGTTRVWDMALVDGEVWASNSTLDCSTTPESIVRIAFDGQGHASLAGNVGVGLVGADRGILWVPATRTLFVGQCYPVSLIQRYQVAADESVTVANPLSGSNVSNPEGMTLAPWGEVLIPNFGNGFGGVAEGPGHELLRYTLDGQGNPTANGTIAGNGLNGPCYAAFTPWGELLVTNIVDATVSRFTFDASHTAIAHGSFPLSAAPSPNGNFGVCSIVVIPGASM